MAPRKLVPIRVRTRVRIGGAAAHNWSRRIEARPSASGKPAVARRRAGSGAYLEERGDARSVPRANILVERRRNYERLRAIARTCTWMRCSHVHAYTLFITKASI